jgi:hypothetical protein
LFRRHRRVLSADCPLEHRLLDLAHLRAHRLGARDRAARLGSLAQQVVELDQDIRDLGVRLDDCALAQLLAFPFALGV